MRAARGTGAAPAASAAGLRGNAIALLSAIGFFAIFSTTMSKSPVLPLFVASMGGDPGLVGLISSVSPLAGILLSFPVGFLADRLGRKRLLLVAASVFAAAPLLYLLVTDPLWLIPIRFFHGVGTAILGPLSSAMVVSAYPEAKGEKLGVYSSATLAGRSLAPLMGGALVSAFAGLSGGWNHRLVYVAAFLLSLPVLALSLLMPKDSPGGGSLGKGERRPLVRDFGRSLALFVSNRRLLGAAIVEMAAYFAYGGLETFLPGLLMSKGVPGYQVGFVFSSQVLAIAVSKPFFGKISDIVDRRLQILGGLIVLGLAFTAIPLAGDIVPAVAIGIVFGLGLSLATVATGSYVADVAREGELGASLGALSSIMDIGHSSGPLLIGLVAGSLGLAAGFITGGVACSLAALAFLALALLHPLRRAG